MAVNRYFEDHTMIGGGHHLTPTEAAGHRNFLEFAESAAIALDRLLDSYPDDHFRPEELTVLRQAASLLRISLVPMALFTVDEPKPILKLHRVRPPEE